MKIVSKIKLILLIVLVGVVIVLNSMQVYYQKQNIEFTSWMSLATVVLTWIALPIYSLAYYNGIIRCKIDDRKVIVASMMGSSVMYAMVTIFFLFRICFFFLFESRNEIELENGLIMVEYENFGANQTFYYEQINIFLYRRVER